MINQFPPRETVAQAYQALHKDLILHQKFQSCLNCAHWQPAPKGTAQGEVCLLYKARPPAETVVYSCGPGWEGDIPF